MGLLHEMRKLHIMMESLIAKLEDLFSCLWNSERLQSYDWKETVRHCIPEYESKRYSISNFNVAI